MSAKSKPAPASKAAPKSTAATPAAKPSKKNPAAITDLLPNPKNPRKDWASPRQKDDFLHSLQTFGDLSGIVFNRTTSQLVGGHKRVDEFKADPHNELVITERLAKPDQAGTLAYGHVILSNGTRFAYREVAWPKPKEAAANLAANKWGADWLWEGVSDLLAEVKDGGFDLALTGFDLAEITPLLAAISTPGGDGDGEGETGAHDASGGMTPEQIAARISYLTAELGNPTFPVNAGDIAIIENSIIILCALPHDEVPAALVRWINPTDADDIEALGGTAGVARKVRVCYGPDAMVLVERGLEQLAKGRRWVVLCPTLASAAAILSIYSRHYEEAAVVEIIEAEPTA